MSNPVKIKVELATGTIDVEADAGNIGAIFDRLDSFIPRLSAAYVTQSNKTMKPTAEDNSGSIKDDSTKIDSRPRSARGSSKSKETYTVVDFGLTEEERKLMREAFSSKQPKSQHEQMAVLMDYLKKIGRKAVSWNDIFTAFRIVDSKSPAKISSVLGNMVGLSWVRNVGSGQYELTHVGEDFVKFNLPNSSSKKSH